MSTRKEALTARAAALRTRLQEERPRHMSVEVGFCWLARDLKIAGGVLGGGLAYRCFFWTLAFCLLVFGGLGFAQHSGSEVDEDAEDVGVGAAMARTIANAAAAVRERALVARRARGVLPPLVQLGPAARASARARGRLGDRGDADPQARPCASRS